MSNVAALSTWQTKEAAKLLSARELVAANPHLVSAIGQNGLIIAAKNIRIELKRAFPGVKFGVRSKSYSMGDSIDVSWIDGPTGEQVDAIIGRYAAGSFNGMDDSYSYSGDAWTAAFGSAKYVHSRRDYSDRAVESAIRTVRAKYAGNLADRGISEISAADYSAGRLWNVEVMTGGGFNRDSCLGSLIGQTLQRRTWALDRTPK